MGVIIPLRLMPIRPPLTSQRFNKQYRIIYKIENELVVVQVVKVTAPDYRRK